MWIIFGSRQRKQELGQIVSACDRCGRETVHLVERLRTWFTLFFVPVCPLSGQHDVRRCNLCGQEQSGGFSSSAARMKCPQCAEPIQAEARVCRFCGHQLTPEQLAECRREHDAAVSSAAEATRAAAISRKIVSFKWLGWLIILPAAFISVVTLITPFLPATPRVSNSFGLHLLVWFFVWLISSTPLLLAIHLLRKARALRAEFPGTR